jgi:DNA-binding beta-propeller fold protein YncE
VTSFTCPGISKDKINHASYIVPIDVYKSWILTQNSSLVILADINGHSLQTIDVGITSRAIAADNRGGLYISCTEDKLIKYANLETGEVSTVGHTDNYPRGLAYHAGLGEVIVCTTKTATLRDWGSHPEYNGQLLRLSPQDSTHAQSDSREIDTSGLSFRYPVQIAINTNGDVCVSDHVETCVVILGSDGGKRGHYSGQAGWPFQPTSVCCDSRGHILVSDISENGSIHVLNASGEIICILKHVEIRNPVATAVDPSGRLWVADANGHVRLFRYS